MNRREYITNSHRRVDRHGIPVLPQDYDGTMRGSEYTECPNCDGSPLVWAGEWLPCPLAGQLPHLHRGKS